MTMVVRPTISRSIACWISASLSLSRLEVASSRISTWRVREEGPRDGDALALAARELDAALAHQGLVALGQALDEVVRIGEPGGFDDRRPRGAGAGIGDVFGQRAVKQDRLLLHDGDLLAQRCLGRRRGYRGRRWRCDRR